MGEPLAPGSVSLRLYPHGDLAPDALVAELTAQAELAAGHGFDGVMTSEHHGGFAGYLPNPLQVAGWCLDVMPRGWAAPCPLLLPLRPPALVAEEAAWLAARYPGRVGVGVAAGALACRLRGHGAHDGPSRRALQRRGSRRSPRCCAARSTGCSPATRRWRAAPRGPCPSSARRWGSPRCDGRPAVGVGILFDSLSTAQRCRELTDAYREAGGTGPCILIRRAWLGTPPRSRLDEQLDRYRSYTPRRAQAHWGDGDRQLVDGSDPAGVADALAAVARDVGADAVNLRIHVPGVAPSAAREQIVALGDGVVPAVRAALGTGVTS